jgi:thioredoxin reductase (NADPH)
MDYIYDTIIIGAGPAGLTAALYAGRYRMKARVFEKMVAGGQILLSPDIHNFPGFPGGVTTQDLIDRFKQQVADVGLSVEDAQVSRVTVSGEGKDRIFEVETGTGVFRSRTVITATGARWKKLGVPGEDKYAGRGVSYCGTCDGPLFRNKEIVVVGGGDRALEDALYLAAIAGKITLVHRRQGFRAAKILEEKVRSESKITLELDSVVEEIEGGVKLESVTVRNVLTQEKRKIACQGIFIFVGVSPNSEIVRDIARCDDAGFITADESMQSSCAGLFACGDCRKKTLYQVVNGCGDGAVAAHSAHTYLLNQ